MSTLVALVPAALLALATVGLAEEASAQHPSPRGDLERLFPTPAAPLTCSASESSLADLLEALSEATGVIYVAGDARVAAALREPRALGIPAGQIAAADAYAVVESQLAAHEFFLTCDRDVTPTTVGVHHPRLSSPGAPVLLEAACDELGFLRRHPALQFAATLELEHLESRTLPSRLRPLLARELAGLGIMPLGFSRTVALSGGGGIVAEALDSLRRLDDEAGASKRSSQSAAVPSALELAFPAPSGSLVVPANVSSLTDLLSSLSQATGVSYTIDASVKAAFDAARVSLQRSITLAPAEAYAWIESQLLAHGFALSCDASSRPASAQVRSVRSSAATDTDCLAIGVGDLDFVRRHPALGFVTTLKLDHLDARTLPSTLRPLLPHDPREGALTASNDLHSIALRGHGRFVAQTVDLLRRFDAEAGRTVGGPGPEGRALLQEASKR